MTSTTRKKRNKMKVWAVAVWLVIWQLVSMWIGQEILLVSPAAVFRRLLELIPTGEFWSSVLFSVVRITGGFLLAAVAGVTAAGLAVKFRRVEEFLHPFVLTVKAIPVASFVILVLIWVPSRNLSVVISFLMVFPILYTNVLDGEKQMDQKLLEMARVFELSRPVRLRYLYLPQILPYFRTGCSVALGLCWKAGVAAEVIGIPDNSIGEQLYNAKVYLNTPDLFAWTVVIVALSSVFERLFLYFIDCTVKRLERMK
ncbi:MAG TPA: ABC transporter permease subunit [Candidatus Fusicatenibacter merdavium]|uniref:ABC transporter permease subunit n=1 Tax=Candidatus Fusicatenibacter merdavium TaxID=2838600 RepID=A0A9D1XBL5_9FIRM|nr:ABC transporter permease subunit [Candidatus Fusicatenibacter merdavium]